LFEQENEKMRKSRWIKPLAAALCAAAMSFGIAACGSAAPAASSSGSTSAVSAASPEAASSSKNTAASSESAAASSGTSASSASAEVQEVSSLKDGTYDADFTTDSKMFRVNDACNGKGKLTVKDGKMTIHISLVSENIVNLFEGTAADAQKEGAELIQPTTDTVTYDDGTTEEVYGFDVPVPALDQEFDLALLGTKGKWYDHKVKVSNPAAAEVS
jgi:uncharacterized glyoxalase superfamily protein PhnB